MLSALIFVRLNLPRNLPTCVVLLNMNYHKEQINLNFLLLINTYNFHSLLIRLSFYAWFFINRKTKIHFIIK